MKTIFGIVLVILTCSFCWKTKNTGFETSERVSVLLRFKAIDGKKQELIDHMTNMVNNLSENEDGTEIHTISTSPNDDYIYVYEVFSSEEALKAHQSSEGYKKGRVKLDALIDGPPQVTALSLQAGKGLK